MVQRLRISLQHRLLNRRRFRKFTLDKKLKHKKVSNRFFFEPEPSLSSLVLLPEEFQSKLGIARKSGGWKTRRMFNKKFYWWKVSHYPYWGNLMKRYFEAGGHSQNISALEIREYLEVDYQPLSADVHSLNMYSFQISRILDARKNYDFEKAFTLEFSAAYAFQHFIDHAYAYINYVVDFLNRNPTMPVILPSPNSSFLDREFLLEKIGLKNPIINVSISSSIAIRSLFLLKAMPNDLLYSVPYDLTKKLSDTIASNSVDNKKIVLVVREEKNRNFANLNQILEVINEFAIQNNLYLEVLFPSRITTKEFASKIQDCFLLIGIHGGALCNMLFLPKKSYILEFVPLREGASLVHLALGGARRYFPLPMEFLTSSETVDIDLGSLSAALNCIYTDHLGSIPDCA